MAAKKKPVGCALGCMGLLVIGGGIGILGVAGGGAWMWLGLDSSAISFDGADLGSLVPHELSETPSVEDDAMADVGDQPADQPEVEADDGSDEADAARIALEQALAMARESAGQGMSLTYQMIPPAFICKVSV